MESNRPTPVVRPLGGRVLTPLALALATPPMPLSPEEDAIGTLRRLVQVCHESQNGLRAASRAAVLPCFRSVLVKFARQRGQIAEELQRELATIEEDMHPSGPVATGARGVWSDVLACSDEGSLLFACERAEESTVRSFAEARRRNLPARLDVIVARSAELVDHAVEHLRSIREH